MIPSRSPADLSPVACLMDEWCMQEILERAGLNKALSLEENDPDADEEGDDEEEEGEERGGADIDDVAAALANKAQI